MTMNSRRRLLTLIPIAFFLSGFTGLVYQILWVRLLTRFVGGSTFSVTVVLAVFMGGLALGSRLASRFVDRIEDSRDLVRLYGAIEIAIGLYAALFPALLLAFRPAYGLLYNLLTGNPIGFGLAAAGLSALLLLPPTTLMGMTLPVLIRYYIRALDKLGTRTGRLYGINTIGAALGALLCGMVLLRWLGVTQSLALAVAVNIFIGLGFLLLVQGSGSIGRAVAQARAAWRAGRAEVRASESAPGTRAILIVATISGACSMAYEVIWTKLLALLVGPTTYSFTLVLFTFIIGLALGSLFFGWLGDRVRHPFGLLVGTQLGAVAAALACSQFLGNSQVFFAKLLHTFTAWLPLLETVKGGTVFLAMFPATFLLGASFPLAVKAATRDADRLGATVARVYMFDTIGAVLGTLVAGFALVPLLGKANSLSLLAIVHVTVMLLVVVVLAVLRARTRRHGGAAAGSATPPYLVKDTDKRSGRGRDLAALSGPGRGAIVLSSLGLILAGSFLPHWDQGALTKGKYHRFEEFADELAQLSFLQTIIQPEALTAHQPNTDRILFMEDGIGGFVSVAESVNSLGATNVFLQISGKTDASSQNDLHTMTLTGQVPMLLHPEARTAMVVGLASGITAGEMLHYPLERVDVLEISPEVVRACRYFDAWNNGVLDDPRAEIILQDARTHITLTDRTYDVIVSEPSNPWMAGVANLFTEDYFRAVKACLNPDGVFVQWYHAYQTDWETFQLVGRTLQAVFPNLFVMKTSTVGTDYLLVAFNSPTSLEAAFASMERGMVYAARSANMRMASPHVLLPLVLAENPAELFGEGPRHTDGRPLLEFSSLRNFYSGGPDFMDSLMTVARLSPWTREAQGVFTQVENRLELADFMASMNISPFGLAGLSAEAPTNQVARLSAILSAYASINRDPPYKRIPDERERGIAMEVRRERLAGTLEQATRERLGLDVLAEVFFDLGNLHVAESDWPGAAEAFRNARLMLPGFHAAGLNLGLAYERMGAQLEAARVYERLVRTRPYAGILWARLAACHLRLGAQARARELFERAVTVDPRCSPALMALGGMAIQANELPEAIALLERAIQADPENTMAYQNLAVAYVQTGKAALAVDRVLEGIRRNPGNTALRRLHAMLTAPPPVVVE